MFTITSFFFLRNYRGKKHFHVFLAELPFACLFYSFLFYRLPENLFFLPSSWLEPHPLIDFTNGFLILLLLTHLLWDAAYAIALTGFSSELMIRLYRQKEGGLSVGEAMKGFGSDQEADRLLQWRLPNLLNCKYVSRDGDTFRLLSRGKKVATFALFLKRLFKMDVEG